MRTKKAGPKPKPPEERFWAKVEKGGGCWLWKGGVSPNGYGKFSIRPHRFMYSAHRIAYELVNGPVPDGMFVLHTCDNRLCVRPEHLRLGSQKDNLLDAVKKGRLSKRLTLLQIQQIRTVKARPSTALLARQYKVTPNTIRRILKNEIWRGIQE